MPIKPGIYFPIPASKTNRQFTDIFMGISGTNTQVAARETGNTRKPGRKDNSNMNRPVRSHPHATVRRYATGWMNSTGMRYIVRCHAGGHSVVATLILAQNQFDVASPGGGIKKLDF